MEGQGSADLRVSGSSGSLQPSGPSDSPGTLPGGGRRLRGARSLLSLILQLGPEARGGARGGPRPAPSVLRLSPPRGTALALTSRAWLLCFLLDFHFKNNSQLLSSLVMGPAVQQRASVACSHVSTLFGSPSSLGRHKDTSHLRCAEDAPLRAHSEEELKTRWMRVEEESGEAGLKLNIHKTKLMASLHGKQMGESGSSDRFSFLGLQNHCRGGAGGAAAMPLKNACSLEEKL